MNIKVFLADDHAMVREGLRFLLESEPDITVIGEAANGRETVRQLTQFHLNQQCPDMVVLDIAMPELNGIEAA